MILSFFFAYFDDDESALLKNKDIPYFPLEIQ